MSQQYQTPSTPLVIPSTPTASESDQPTTYFAPITRSATKHTTSPPSISEQTDEEEDSDPSTSSDSSLEKRARTRSRSPKTHAKLQKQKPQPQFPQSPPQPQNGHLSPPTPSSTYWRTLSRSPSPLGLIPIHTHWRTFIHRHEIPRKTLHLSIGFLTLHLYTRGTPPSQIHPYLLSALIPIATTDILRLHYPAVNRVYIRCLGALMRESEVDGYNGVIWYLLGAWTVLRFMPKDVGCMAILLLSWCDTAASTFGRLYGRYTPRIRRGKSVAGSAAAAVVGVLTAGVFYGWAVPRWGYDGDFMFRGTLGMPGWLTSGEGEGKVGGWVALGVVGLWSGIVASVSEVVDVFGWDDNVTIPVLSGLGLWGFFKVFT